VTGLPEAKYHSGMKIAAILLGFLLCAQAWAKPPKDAQYQDAVLVSFKDVKTGSSCSSSGSVKANTDDSGNTEGSTSNKTNCSNNIVRQYTIQLGSNTFVLVYGYNFLNLHNDLSKQLPGAHLRVRSDKHGFYVRIGDKEARYDIVEAK
jgi:hypothetical protein